MRPALMSACFVSLAAAATAQTTSPSLRTLTDVGVFAKAGTAADYDFVAKDTALNAPLSLVSGVEGATAGTSATIEMKAGAIVAMVGEKGSAALRTGSASAGTSASNDPRNVVPGPHSFLLVVPLKKDTKTNVVVHFEGRVTTDAAKSDVAIDVGDDNSVEFKQVADGKPYHMEIPAVATDRGVVVKITTSGLVELKAAGESSYGAITTVSVQMGMGGGRCSFEAYGKTCGPKMAAVEEHVRGETFVVLTIAGAHPSMLAAILFGTDRQSVQFPRTECFLNLVPLLALPHTIDDRGGTTLRFLLPAQVSLSLLTQDAIFFRTDRGMSVESTNGLAMACK